MPMRKRRTLPIVGVCALLVVAIILRWPRLESQTVLVTRSEVRGNQMVLEYRMTRPFEVGLRHGVRKPNDRPDGPRIHIASTTESRKLRVAFVPSQYDPLRGEHFVRISLQRGQSVTVDANGQLLEFAALSAPDAKDAQWLPPRKAVRFG